MNSKKSPLVAEFDTNTIVQNTKSLPRPNAARSFPDSAEYVTSYWSGSPCTVLRKPSPTHDFRTHGGVVAPRVVARSQSPYTTALKSGTARRSKRGGSGMGTRISARPATADWMGPVGAVPRMCSDCPNAWAVCRGRLCVEAVMECRSANCNGLGCDDLRSGTSWRVVPEMEM